MKYWLIAVSSLVSRSFRIFRIAALPCIVGRSPSRATCRSQGSARPYRHERGATTRAAARRTRRERGIGIALEPLAQLAEAGAAVGAGAAALPDLLDRRRALRDHSLEVAVTDAVAAADDHVA